jgi:CRP-like cAMP-binding protein
MQPGICDLKEGAVFGESCLHISLPRIATVTAITEATLLEINGERLSIFLDENPVQGYLFYKNLFELLIVRLNSANQRVETLISWGLKAHEIDRYL